MREEKPDRTSCNGHSTGSPAARHRLTSRGHQNATPRPAGSRLDQPIVQRINIDARVRRRLQRQRRLPPAGSARIACIPVEAIDRYRAAGCPGRHLRRIRKRRFHGNSARINGGNALHRHIPCRRFVSRNDLAGTKPKTGKCRQACHKTPRSAVHYIFRK